MLQVSILLIYFDWQVYIFATWLVQFTGQEIRRFQDAPAIGVTGRLGMTELVPNLAIHVKRRSNYSVRMEGIRHKRIGIVCCMCLSFVLYSERS